MPVVKKGKSMPHSSSSDECGTPISKHRSMKRAAVEAEKHKLHNEATFLSPFLHVGK